MNYAGSMSCSKIPVSGDPLGLGGCYLGKCAMHSTGIRTEIATLPGSIGSTVHEVSSSSRLGSMSCSEGRKGTNQGTPRTASSVTLNSRNALDPFTILLSGISPKSRTHGQQDTRQLEVLPRAAAKQEFEGCAKLIYRDAAGCAAK